MVVIVIVGILATIAVPSFNDFIVKNRVKQAAEEIYGLILQAKSEGRIRNDVDGMSISVDTATWCVGFAADPGCDCTDSTSCAVNVAGADVAQIVDGAAFPGVAIAENFTGAGTTFNPRRGNASSGGTITVSSGNWALSVIVSVAGRVRVCNPNNNVLTGYQGCN